MVTLYALVVTLCSTMNGDIVCNTGEYPTRFKAANECETVARMKPANVVGGEYVTFAHCIRFNKEINVVGEAR